MLQDQVTTKTRCTHILSCLRKVGKVLFNNALNTFYLWLYGVRHMVKDHSDSERGNRCRHIGYSFRLAARVLLYASSHRQDNTYHGLCYTSRGALAGTRNSSMGSPHEGSILKLFNARTNAIRTFSLRIEQFLFPSLTFQTFWKHLHTLFYHLMCKTTADCTGSGASEKRFAPMHLYKQLFMRIGDSGSRNENFVACATDIPSDTVISMRLTETW